MTDQDWGVLGRAALHLLKLAGYLALLPLMALFAYVLGLTIFAVKCAVGFCPF